MNASHQSGGQNSILHIIAGLSDGGTEAVLYRLITADRTHSHAVISLTGMGKYGPLLTEAGIDVRALDMPRGRVTLTGLWRLWRLILTSNVDVIQTWMYHADFIGGLASRLAGKRALIWNIRNASLDAKLISRQTRWVVRACAWRSRVWPTRIVSCSSRAAERHVKSGYAHNKMTVIPNGYDTSRLGPDLTARARLRAEWEISRGVVLMGMVARWNVQKDHKNLIGALASLSPIPDVEWRCLLVGSGMSPTNTELVDMLAASDLSERVLLLGQRQDIPAVMNAIDLHVLSSANEGFPNVVAEAMASGTPCVVTDVGDAALIVGESGWVVPARDSKQLAVAIEAALSEIRNASAWALRKRIARERIEKNFSLDQMVQAYSEVWDEAAKA